MNYVTDDITDTNHVTATNRETLCGLPLLEWETAPGSMWTGGDQTDEGAAADCVICREEAAAS